MSQTTAAIKVTLPDGSVREVAAGTSPAEIAAALSSALRAPRRTGNAMTR